MPTEGSKGIEFGVAGFIYSGQELVETVKQVAETVRVRTGADMASVLLVGPRSETWAGTDPVALEMDEAQIDSAGPGLDAAHLNSVVTVDDVATDERWPTWRGPAMAKGIRSILSLPMPVGGEVFAALNLYAFRARAFSALAPTDEVIRVAEEAAVVLFNAREYWNVRANVDNLQKAMQSRSTIEQAVGILMAPGGLTPAEAFQTLVRASQRENRKLRVIAEEIVERTVERRPRQLDSDG